MPDQTADAFEMLEEIYNTIVEGDALPNGGERYVPEGMPRDIPGRDTEKYTALSYIRDNEPVTSDQLRSAAGKGYTRLLTRAFYSGLIDRSENRPYRYWITEWGKQALQEAEEQQDLGDAAGQGAKETNNPEPKPWEKAGVSERAWQVLSAVVEYDGHPTTQEIGEEVGLEVSQVSPQTTRLYSKGYLGRPPEQPYRYWSTEEGREAYRKAR